jgi:CHAT domain-containing protein
MVSLAHHPLPSCVAWQMRYDDTAIMICSPHNHPLPKAMEEAQMVETFTSSLPILSYGTLSDLDDLLANNPYLKVLHLIMHGDAAWRNPDGSVTSTPAWTDMKGNIITEAPETVVRIIAAHAKQLELVFINACETAPLGDALVAAGVRRVICWETIVNDEVAFAFSKDFYDAKKRMAYTYEAAFRYAWYKNAANLCRLKRVNGVPGVLVNVPRMVVSSQ